MNITVILAAFMLDNLNSVTLLVNTSRSGETIASSYKNGITTTKSACACHFVYYESP